MRRKTLIITAIFLTPAIWSCTQTKQAEPMGISADGVHALIRRARWKMRDMDEMRLAWDEYRGVA